MTRKQLIHAYINKDFKTVQRICTESENLSNVYRVNDKTLVRFIQAIKKGDFKFAQSIMHPLFFSCANCNKIMELKNGGANNVLHRFTEFRPILVHMINRTKRIQEIKIESTYIDYAFIGVYQGDGPTIDRDYFVNLGQGTMNKICL